MKLHGTTLRAIMAIHAKTSSELAAQAKLIIALTESTVQKIIDCNKRMGTLNDLLIADDGERLVCFSPPGKALRAITAIRAKASSDVATLAELMIALTESTIQAIIIYCDKRLETLIDLLIADDDER
jgi:hypothetical protein